MAEVATATLPRLSGPINEHHRKSSKLGNMTSSKKQHSDTNPAEKAQLKRKRSKSGAASVPSLAPEAVENDLIPKQKRKSHKSSEAKDSHTEQDRLWDDAVEDDGEKERKRLKRKNGDKKEKKEKKKEKKRSKKSRESEDRVLDDDNDDDNNDNNDNDGDITTGHGLSGVVVLDSSPSTTYPGARKPSKHQYPFYTQTVSQYLPLPPVSINEPIHGYMNQHLEPLLNRYVPSFGGVLLSYRNPRIGEAPGRGSVAQDSGMEDTVVLESVNEYAVSFGWLTVQIDIFRPSRGASLEGLVIIQSRGHIGVVCWGKFNASIESERLPRDWRWIDQHASEEEEDAEPEATSPLLSAQDDTETDHAEVHATGYWVNRHGVKLAADTPISFRIKNYEVGTSGDYGYLSIEGTMLTEEEEAEKAQKEREVQKRKLSRGVVPHRARRALLELGMTKFTESQVPEA
ncbi:hypothetical protein F4823DRAFT_210874 [Ustulina deusta]|nr:hypothetical protein F4823DRAFT_210874 [Ustulina deusta]